MSRPFFTIGHSTRSVRELAALLAANGVERLVDVRTIPMSRMNPQFNRDVLPQGLAAHGIAYEHLAALGGRRPRQKEVAPEVNAFWENASFHNYADYAMGAEFQRGLGHLRAIGARETCAVMCAESVWWQCHRRIIADYLLASGEDVCHIVAGEVPEPALMTPRAEPVHGVLCYPGSQAGLAF